MYKPLIDSWETQLDDPRDWEGARKPRSSLRWNIAMTVLLATNLVLTGLLIKQHFSDQLSVQGLGQSLYSPAQDVLKSRVIKAANGFRQDTTIFQGEPSPDLDEAWESLYSFGVSRITKSQARLLPNKTTAIPGDTEHYVVELDVFHELHCLNMIRKALKSEYYKPMMVGDDGEDELFGHTHIDHCVDSIRQSLMCSADISPLVWQWKEEFEETKIRADIVHSCRDFDSIREWAVEHHLEDELDLKTRVDDDIVIAEF